MSQFSLSNHAKKIGPRNWDDLSGEWKNYLPELPADLPREEVEDLTQLTPVYEETTRPNRPSQRHVEPNINMLRESFYMASISYLVKSINIFNSAFLVSSSGFRTWSRSICYQSAFLSMRSISLLLGCTVLRQKATDKHFQADIWWVEPAYHAPRVQSPYSFSFHTRSPPNHSAFWEIFIRLLHSTTVDKSIWDHRIVDPLKRMNAQDIPVSRNMLHYRATNWLYEDLLARDHTDDFESIQNSLSNDNLQSPNPNDFYFRLAILLPSLAVSLYETIDQYGGVGTTQWNAIKTEGTLYCPLF